MVYKLKPLELSFDFEDRVYDLGDTVDLQVTLTPNSDVDVRGGRVDLVCDQRYVQRATTFVPYVQSQWRVRGQTRDVTTEREERVVHSTVSLLERARLTGGTPTIRPTRLLIQPTPPPHFEEATALQHDAQSSWAFKWTLVAIIDIVRGRNPRAQRAVKVGLPQAQAGSRVGAKPRTSRPKRSTGPAP